MTFERLYELALKRLSRRERSLSEMRQYLEAKFTEETEESALLIDRVLQKLVSIRYLDEERMAAALIREQRLQARGPRAAWMKLRRRGITGWSLERVEELWRQEEDSFFQPAAVEGAVADGGADALANAADGEVEIARRWVVRRYRGLTMAPRTAEARADLQKEVQRALGALVRRGYSFPVARKAVDSARASTAESLQDDDFCPEQE